MNNIFNMGPGQMFFPGFGIVIQIILFVVLFGVIYWVVKSGSIGNDNPEAILKKRLAKGEISKKEYHEILKEINE